MRLTREVTISVAPNLWASMKAYHRYQRLVIVFGRAIGLAMIGVSLAGFRTLTLGVVLLVAGDLAVLAWLALNRQVFTRPLRVWVTAEGLTWARGETEKSATWSSLRVVRPNHDYWFFRTSVRGLLIVPKSAANPEDRALVERFMASL